MAGGARSIRGSSTRGGGGAAAGLWRPGSNVSQASINNASPRLASARRSSVRRNSTRAGAAAGVAGSGAPSATPTESVGSLRAAPPPRDAAPRGIETRDAADVVVALLQARAEDRTHLRVAIKKRNVELAARPPVGI